MNIIKILSQLPVFSGMHILNLHSRKMVSPGSVSRNDLVCSDNPLVLVPGLSLTLLAIAVIVIPDIITGSVKRMYFSDYGLTQLQMYA